MFSSSWASTRLEERDGEMEGGRDGGWVVGGREGGRREGRKEGEGRGRRDREKGDREGEVRKGDRGKDKTNSGRGGCNRVNYIKEDVVVKEREEGRGVEGRWRGGGGEVEDIIPCLSPLLGPTTSDCSSGAS